MNKYLTNFKKYFKTDKINKITLKIKYQRFIEKFNKNFKFRMKVISTAVLLSKILIFNEFRFWYFLFFITWKYYGWTETLEKIIK